MSWHKQWTTKVLQRAELTQLIHVVLVQHKVMVTAGANQAFVNLVLALLDPQDAVILFAPYYFNHMMALQVQFSPFNANLASALLQCSQDEEMLLTDLAQVSVL